MDILKEIERSLRLERDAISALLERVDGACERAVTLLHECEGHIVVTGMGKAGYVGRKLASTFSSIGAPAYFLHPAEALHGDLGGLRPTDVVLAISNSGESGEIVELLPHLNRAGVPIIALTGNPQSTLGRAGDIVLNVGVKEEADSLGLVPTASTTAAMAMGDALAGALMKLKGFTRAEYGRYHPGGSLGNLLHLRVRDLMVSKERLPLVNGESTVGDIIVAMTSGRLGAAFVTDEGGRLSGVVTDGDLRRLFQRESNPLAQPVREVMTTEAKRVSAGALAIDAMRLMEDHAITVLPVVDGEQRPISAIHMHDLVQAGLSSWTAGRE